ncbi:MAG: saccharopine dehydrogenase C-terminal domain-containing protein [Gammaproteobacteria bacterium]|nr:saccharopine dehydrogenase C-terminal domain-containing protein [Gammaproteobacteria bacterium]
MMHKIVILGLGRIGKSIARLLQDSGDYTLCLVDKFQHSVDKLDPDLKVQALTFDVTNKQQLLPLLQSNELVFSACSFKENPIIAETALEAGCSYFDLTEDIQCTQEIIKLAEQASKGQVFMPQCGLAPGFIAILGYDLSRRFSKLFKLKMRVGALPKFPTNRMLYNLTWSTDGLINEYCNPCEAIKNGQYTHLLPLEGLETFSLDGVEYEAFNTSGGLGTLCDTLSGEVQDLTYKTIRYPGHRLLMDFLFNELRLGETGKRRETLKQILETSIAVTNQDLVIVMASATGIVDDRLMELTEVYKIYHRELYGKNWSAIQLSTASAACVAIDLFFKKKLPQQGFIKQETIVLKDFLDNPFAHFYREAKEHMNSNKR